MHSFQVVAQLRGILGQEMSPCLLKPNVVMVMMTILKPFLCFQKCSFVGEIQLFIEIFNLNYLKNNLKVECKPPQIETIVRT